MKNKKVNLYGQALVVAVSLVTLLANYGAVSEAFAQDPEQDSWIPWCEHPNPNEDPNDPNDDFVCHWYQLTESDGTWDAAENEAVSKGGHLVTINSDEENNWVFDNLAQNNRWIGFFQNCGDAKCTDNPCEPAGCWKWVSGESLTYTNWASGEPNNDQIGEHWAELKGQESAAFHHRWNDLNQSTSSHRGIVERQSLEGKIPAVSEWGLVVLTLLVAAAGTIVVMKRRRRIA